MKKLGMKCILTAMAVGMFAMVVSANYYVSSTMVTGEKTESTEQVAEYELNVATDGMYFSSEYVVEEWELDDAYGVSYTNEDAGLNECSILLDRASYLKVIDAIESGEHINGNLWATGEYNAYGDPIYKLESIEY